MRQAGDRGVGGPLESQSVPSEKRASSCGVRDPPAGDGADDSPEMGMVASDLAGEESVAGRFNPAGDAGGAAVRDRGKGGRQRRPHGIEGEKRVTGLRRMDE